MIWLAPSKEVYMSTSIFSSASHHNFILSANSTSTELEQVLDISQL